MSGVYPSTAGTYTLLLPQGMTGAQGGVGAAGAAGAQGPAGPTGPLGPAGASSPAYTIHYYFKLYNLGGDSIGTGYQTAVIYEACPTNELPIAASCGYDIPTSTNDQHNLNVNYSGLELDANGVPTGQAQCNVTNSATESRNVRVGISCLAKQ